MLVARCGTYETAVEEAKSFGDENASQVYHVHYVDERVPGTMMWGFWAVDEVDEVDEVIDFDAERAAETRNLRGAQ